jgi:hypothetical protein
MRFAVSLLLAAPLAAQFHYTAPPGPWDAIFEAAGIRAGAPAGLEHLTIAIGEQHGAQATAGRVTVRRILDTRQPTLEIFWDPPAAIPHFSLAPEARILAWEWWTQAPVLAYWKDQRGDPVLWLATAPGERGYERYPYLIQTLTELGLESPARGDRLWAFFDSSYRLRADVDRLAKRWSDAGISAIHVAAWHYWEPDAGRDAWLARLIETCHRHAIHVHAWIEFPHVSERFWKDHPEWREQTGLLADAHLDWRKLINLRDPACAREVNRGLRALIARFDWDGVNLGELYFESLEGYSNPARFTPFNANVRREFQSEAGFDPAELFLSRRGDAAAMRRFLDYRARLTQKMQAEWLAVLAELRAARPQLDVTLTHIDDRFDTQMRDLLGADAAAVLPLLDRHDFTFLIEDPATTWHLGPKRYEEIARRYRALTSRKDRLAIDLNIVERYQDVYPTKQQTGVELFQLVQIASRAFDRVALYFENSILPGDLPHLASASAVYTQIERTPLGLTVESPREVLVRWRGPAKLDGEPWPFTDGDWARIPAGRHRIEPGAPGPTISRFNGDIVRAVIRGAGIELEYSSRSRAIAIVNGRARMLPPGRRTVYLEATS